MLNYGNKKILIEEENIYVYKMIINDLSFDNITFSNLFFNNLYLEITKEIKLHNKINIEHFINHPNEDISSLAVDLISDEHTISENWKEQHNIFTTREDEKMKKTTEKSILSLKKCHVDLEINMLQKKIKTGEINLNDMEKLNTLTKIKTDIAKILGRNGG